MAWMLSDVFSDAPLTEGETVYALITNPPLNLSKEFSYSRYGFEDNNAFEIRVSADIRGKVDLLNAQYNRRQSQVNRFRRNGTAKPTTEGSS